MTKSEARRRHQRAEAGATPAPGAVTVDQPLFLITQAQRSGGTLLLRLLDGHPELHVVPFQLRGIDQAAKRMPGTAAEAWAAP